MRTLCLQLVTSFPVSEDRSVAGRVDDQLRQSRDQLCKGSTTGPSRGEDNDQSRARLRKVNPNTRREDDLLWPRRTEPGAVLRLPSHRPWRSGASRPGSISIRSRDRSTYNCSPEADPEGCGWDHLRGDSQVDAGGRPTSRRCTTSMRIWSPRRYDLTEDPVCHPAYNKRGSPQHPLPVEQRPFRVESHRRSRLRAVGWWTGSGCSRPSNRQQAGRLDLELKVPMFLQGWSTLPNVISSGRIFGRLPAVPSSWPSPTSLQEPLYLAFGPLPGRGFLADLWDGYLPGARWKIPKNPPTWGSSWIPWRTSSCSCRH